MKAFAAFVVDKRKYVLVLYVLLIAAGIVGLFYTNVNYDMSKYLPSDSSVKEGMAVMDEEFGSLSSITVMFTGLDESERQTVRQALAQVENVKSVAYTAGDDAYDRGENAKYVLTIGAGTYSDEAREVLRTLRTQFSDYDVSYSGAVADNDLLITTLTEEIPVIVLIAAVVILLILFCLCESWLEPLLFVGCIGIAVVLNMGSNAFLPSVSFMTFAVGALLQVGLSMDYSIMLMNRYALERQSEPDPASAMKKALAGAFGAITSSSVTTIVGLLALLFMSFAIGRDMGIVLAKGVLISLLCIFTALPGMIVKLDGPLRRTQKKALHFPTAPLMRFVARARFILIPVVAAVIVGAFFLKDGVPVNYIKMFDNPDQEKIEAVFGLENQTVVLYDKNTPDEAVCSFIEALEAREDVRSVEDYSNTVGLPLTYSELAAGFGMEPALAQTVYRLYADRMNTEPLGSLTVYEYLQFIAQLAEDDAFAPLIGGNADILSAMLDALESGKAELDAAIEELDRSEAELEAAQAQLDDLEAGNADYSALQERYDSFAVNSLTAEELSLSDRKDVLALLENTVASTAELQTVVISGNVVELQFANASLDDVSRVVASLESDPLVAGVSMSTAKTDKHDDVVSTVTILLVGAYGGTAGADAEDGVASGAEGAAAGMATGDASGAGDAADAGGQNGAKHE